MEDISGLILLMILIGLLLWLTPLLIILSSSKTTGKEKLAWIIAMLFISWFAFVIYLLIAPVKAKEEEFR